MPFTICVAIAILSALWGHGAVPADWCCLGLTAVSAAALEGYHSGVLAMKKEWEPKVDAGQLRISELCREQDALRLQVEALKKDLAAAYHGKESGNGH